MKKQLYVLLFWLIPLFGGAQISDKLTISKQDINTEKVNGYDKIGWKSDFRTKEVGVLNYRYIACRMYYP